MAPIRNFRLTEYNPSADETSLVPGQLGFSIANNAFHDADAASNAPDPRRNPPPDLTPAPVTPNTIRGWRAPTVQGRPKNNAEGFDGDPLTGYAIGNQSGGALTGAFSDSTDPDAHFGFDPLRGEKSQESGVGLRDYGNWGDAIPGQYVDVQAHLLAQKNQRFINDRLDYQSGMTLPIYSADEEVLDDVNTYENVNAQPAFAIEKPMAYFTGGRPSKSLTPWLFARAFDQWASQNFTGQKVYPSMPPNVGGSLLDNTILQASLPIRQNDEALGVEFGDTSAYAGPSFGASGMQASAPTPNSWRLQPQPWDNALVNTGF